MKNGAQSKQINDRRVGVMGIKCLAILGLAVVISGCGMSPEEINAEKQRCVDNDLEPKLIINVWNYKVGDVVCY